MAYEDTLNEYLNTVIRPPTPVPHVPESGYPLGLPPPTPDTIPQSAFDAGMPLQAEPTGVDVTSPSYGGMDWQGGLGSTARPPLPQDEYVFNPQQFFLALEGLGAGMRGVEPLSMKLATQRRQTAYQQQQQAEQKRQHDLGLLERVISNPRASVMLAQLSEDQNYSMAPQAKMLSKALKDTDYASFNAYQQFIPQEIQARFLQGQLPYEELTGWLDEARNAAKVNAKEAAKARLLQQALDTPPDNRTPYMTQLVEEHKTAVALKQADIDLKKAQTQKALTETAKDKAYGQDREAITKQLFGKDAAYGHLDPSQMAQVNDRLAAFQGAVQYKKSAAVQQAQLEVPDKPSPEERKQLTLDSGTLEQLDNLSRDYKSAFVGPVAGRYGKIIETFGGIGEDEAVFRAEVAALRNQTIKLITGAQMSEPEAQRIMRQIPDENNPPTVFEARLAATRRNILMMSKKYREILKSSGIDTSKLPPLQETPSKSGDRVKAVLDEVLGQ